MPAGATVTFGINNRYVETIIPPSPPTPPEPPVLNKKDHFAYIIGDNRGLVEPDASISRAEVATIFFRLLTDASRAQLWTQANGFSDVDLEDWYNNAVSTMARGGIIVGYPDGTFRPDAPITRAEAMTIINRLLERHPHKDRLLQNMISLRPAGTSVSPTCPPAPLTPSPKAMQPTSSSALQTPARMTTLLSSTKKPKPRPAPSLLMMLMLMK